MSTCPACQHQIAPGARFQGDIPRAPARCRKYLATSPPDADRIRASLDTLP